MRGGRILLIGGSLATAGCAASHEFQVRAIPDPATKIRQGGAQIAEARSMLALGNAGLALEAFRKILREQPANADAYAGIAACYAQMGRYDLERANYEFALAYAPHDPALLNALATSLDRLGEGAKAMEIRAELVRMAAAPKSEVTEAATTPVNVPQLSSVTVKLPAARPPAIQRTALSERSVPVPPARAIPAPATRSAEVELRTVRAPALNMTALDAGLQASLVPAPEPVRQEPILAMPAPRATSTQVELPSVSPPVLQVAARAVDLPGSLVPAAEPPREKTSVAMPVPREASAKLQIAPLAPAVLHGPAADLDVPIVLAVERQPDVAPAVPREPPKAPVPKQEIAAAVANNGPFLERLSTGEVALVTTSEPLWRPQAAPRIAQEKPERPAPRVKIAPAEAKLEAAPRIASNTEVRWVPLRNAAPRPTIQLLNAARSQGLAASTRTALLDKGWRKLGIGNASTVRERSLVLYTPLRERIGKRLAAHFGCKAMKVEGADRVVVLLGRDAARRRSGSSRA
jgi:hypothetical protein